MMRLALLMFLLCSNSPRVSGELILTVFLKKIFLFPYASRLVTLVVVAGDNFYNLGFCLFVFETIVGDEPLFFITLSAEGGRGVSRPILKSLW